MHYYEIAPNQIIRNNEFYFTYHSSKKLSIGQIVLIEIGKKTMPGIVIKSTTKPTFMTKEITSVIESEPLPGQLLELANWLSKYYLTHYANVLQTILPTGIQKKRNNKTVPNNSFRRNRTNFVLNNDQLSVLQKIKKYREGTFLLQGITGSGKTAIYIELIKTFLKNNRSAIIIIPEISLTSQLVAELSIHFDDILVAHSKMTEQKRHSAWITALNSKKPIVVIGPRSALFMPIKNIGAIIIDEAHEPSLKQEQAPKYSALRVATMLGRYHNAKVIFGSATPSIIDRYLAESSDKPILKLSQSASENNKPPTIMLVDMKKRTNFKQHRFLSDELLKSIKTNLESNKQTLIFHNRRGSTNITLCNNCGWSSECSNCKLPLTLHADKHKLICHICNQSNPVPNFCPICKQADIIHKGIGTKLIETEIKKLFPSANTVRFDADNKTSETLDKRYSELYDGSIDIIIGTQIVAKGLDLPHLRTVGILQADLGLSMPDFSTNERSFQLLSQVIGRVGRNEHETSVIVQAYQPDQTAIKFGIQQNYEEFYMSELKNRKKGNFPPYTHLLKLTCSYKSEASVIKNAKKISELIKQNIPKDVEVLGPAPAFHERQGDNYRWQLTIKSPRRDHLIKIVKIIPSKNWQSELDPTSLL